jgi:hypothetical protein
MDKIRGELLNRKREEYFQAYQMEARKRMEEAKQITINEALFAQTSGI